MISLLKEASDLTSYLCKEFKIDSELESEMKSVLSTLRSNVQFYSHNAIGIFVLKCYLKRGKRITAIQVASFLKRINFRLHDRLLIHKAIQQAQQNLSSEEFQKLSLDGWYLDLGDEPDEVKFEDPDLFDKTQIDKRSNPPRGLFFFLISFFFFLR